MNWDCTKNHSKSSVLAQSESKFNITPDLHMVLGHIKANTWHGLTGARKKGNQRQGGNKKRRHPVENPIHGNPCNTTQQNDKTNR